MAISKPLSDTQPQPAIVSRALSSEQQQIIDMFGWPHSFTMLEVESDEGKFHCSETWTYYDGEITYIFLDGEYQTWEPIDPIPMDSLVTPYRPNEFLLGTSPDQVALAIGSGDSWIKAEYAGLLLEGLLDEVEIYVAPQLVAGFNENRLIFLEALALMPTEGEE